MPSISSMYLCNHFNSAGVTTLRRSAAAYERELFGHGVPLPVSDVHSIWSAAACDRLRTRRTPMKSLVIAGLLSVLMIGRANTQVYYTYPEWDRLSDQARTMYIAGAYDSLVSISSPDTASISRHYSKCVSGRVPIEQLAKNVRTFVAARPDLQKKPVQVGLINYLIELCGAPPN
jgi:hypothetical protein